MKMVSFEILGTFSYLHSIATMVVFLAVLTRTWTWQTPSQPLHGLPAVHLDRLQSVLNAAARLIYRRRKFNHVLPLLKELHWLRVPERITFRLAVLAYRCQHNMAPCYLTAQLHQASNIGYRQRLRSSSSSAMLDVPGTEHVAIGGRAFGSTAARLWNSLPTAVQSSGSLDIFWRQLNCSNVLPIDTVPVKRLYCCVTHFHFPCSFLLWPQPWSLSTIMLLWHSFLIIIIIHHTCA